jgi:NADH:ubiquinone reductase (H+-translocating)
VLAYNTLLYGAGSTIDTASVPGVHEYAHAFRGPAAAAALDADARAIAAGGGRFLVCGGGLTGIEAATELAERHPSLAVTLLSPEPPGHWLSARARRHLARAFDRLGIAIRTGARVTGVHAGVAELDDGATVAFDGCVWAGGFTVPSLAREAGLAVDVSGRVVVDETLRSVSHPDVYAIGDAAAARGPDGSAIAMGCRTGGFTGPYAANVVADRLAGRVPRPFRFRYVHECISLGRADAVIQFLRADGRPSGAVLTGRVAAAYKEVVLGSAGWLFRHPIL